MIRFLLRGGTLLSGNGISSQLQVSCRFHLSSKVFQENIASSQPKKRMYVNLKEVKKKKIDAYALSLLIMFGIIFITISSLFAPVFHDAISIGNTSSASYIFLCPMIPVASFGLGVWQIKRKAWKEDLIQELKKRTSQKPVALPLNSEELESMEFCPVTLKGKFHHDRELYMGPRSLLLEEGKLNLPSGLASTSKVGYLVVTPFELSDSGKTILVNRGWIPSEKYKNRRRHPENDISNEVELTGLVRLNERRPPLGMHNNPESRLFVYRDLPKMAEIANTEPIFVDADASSTVPGGPIGGQSRVSLRNEHLSYIITWFGLGTVTGLMWYSRFIRSPHLW